MTELSNINLNEILSSFFNNDEDFSAMATIFSEILQRFYEEYKALLETEVPVVAIEHLLWENHVDFFDPSLSTEQKISLIEESDEWHSKKGTPWAVEQAVSVIFDDAEVIEWFQYNGLPFRFKIETSSVLKSLDDFHLFLKLVDSVKRKSTRLEELTLKRTISAESYIGGFIVQSDQTIIRPADFKMDNLMMDTRLGGIIVEYKTERMT